MFLSHLTLKQEVGQIQLLKQMGRNKYQLHQLLWNLFEGESVRKNDQGKQLADFIYRADYPEKQLMIYLVSSREPQNRDGIWKISSKLFNPEVERGQMLQFHLRVNPTISLYGREKNQRHDALMHAKFLLKERLKITEDRKPDHEEIWQATRSAVRQWLVKRENSLGLRVDSDQLIIDNYRKERITNTAGNSNPIVFSTIDCQGILTVTDPIVFTQKALFSGIGKSKAFGCGLMLVRRI